MYKAFFDRRQPWAFMRTQTFDSVPVDIKDSRMIRAVELLREAEKTIKTVQEDYGHLDGEGLLPYQLRCEQEISELIRKLSNLRRAPHGID